MDTSHDLKPIVKFLSFNRRNLKFSNFLNETLNYENSLLVRNERSGHGIEEKYFSFTKKVRLFARRTRHKCQNSGILETKIVVVSGSIRFPYQYTSRTN